MFIIEYKKSPTISYLKVKFKFLFYLHQSIVTNDQYVTKMTLCARMGGLWGDFTIIVWIVEYLQRSIHI
jgi:hypothetical protein